LAFPVGHCGHVGLSGFLLSGGLGWNSGVWGPACLSITQGEAGTADGPLARAGGRRNADLLLAARWAGPRPCAAVTRFRLELYPLPKAITSSTYIYALEDVENLARWAAQARAALRPAVELTLLLAPAPPEVSRTGKRVVLVTGTAFVDSRDDACQA